MRKLAFLAGLASLPLAASSALATQVTYTLSMTGAQEVPGPGDTDGTGAGTLVNSLTQGNLAQITAILNSPQNFYVNIHNGAFGAGAVRGQVPEPATALLFGSGLAGLAFAGRRVRGERS